MPAEKRLLDVRQMARFVADGYLRFDALVPEEMCRRVREEYDCGLSPNVWPDYRGQPRALRPGQRLRNFFQGAVVGEILDLEEVRGIITSLVGPEPLYDHHFFHVTKPGSGAQRLHYDAIVDFRLDFDIQLFFYLHDTPREMGGTLILPGSHLRPAPDLSRMHNVVGQLPLVCPAGTLVVCHHGIWHGGQPNRSDADRYMLKIRLNPTVRQTRLWDVSSAEADPDVDDDVRDILTSEHGWQGGDLRHEIVRRTKLWRLLTGDEDYDTESWLRRVDCAPSGRRLAGDG